MTKIRNYLNYEENPVSFLIWYYFKQLRKFCRTLTDKNFVPDRPY